MFHSRVRALEELAHKMLNKAKRRPTRKTKSNGIQVSAELSAALRLFDAADKVRGRLQRAGPKVVTSSRKSKWDGLL